MEKKHRFEMQNRAPEFNLNLAIISQMQLFKEWEFFT